MSHLIIGCCHIIITNHSTWNKCHTSEDKDIQNKKSVLQTFQYVDLLHS